jgi:hypothetical protein
MGPVVDQFEEVRTQTLEVRVLMLGEKGLHARDHGARVAQHESAGGSVQ